MNELKANNKKRFNQIDNWLNKNFIKDKDLQKTKVCEDDEEMSLYNFYILEIDYFYKEFRKDNESVVGFLKRNYKGKDFFEQHEKLANMYYQ